MARPTPPPRELTYVPLASIVDDTTFRLRQPGDVSSLARSIAQAGQLFPIEVRPAGDGFQPITGFRRLAALRILFRQRVLVRVHSDLADDAAALVAAADALDNRPLEREELLELRERYRLMGWTTPAFEELLTRALEKAEERLEDLAAQLQGLPPPDRTVVDEDELDEDGNPLSPAAPPAATARAEAARAPAAAGEGASPPPDHPAAGAESAAAPAPDAEAPPTVVTRDLEGIPRPAPRAASAEVGQAPDEPPGAIPLGKPLPPTQAAPRELSAADLAEDAAGRLSLLSQDLAALASHWEAVPAHLRQIVTDQIDYYRQLGAYFEPESGDQQ